MLDVHYLLINNDSLVLEKVMGIGEILQYLYNVEANRNLLLEITAFIFNRSQQEQLEETMDKLFVSFGCKILEIVPGRVSIEVMH